MVRMLFKISDEKNALKKKKTKKKNITKRNQRKQLKERTNREV